MCTSVGFVVSRVAFQILQLFNSDSYACKSPRPQQLGGSRPKLCVVQGPVPAKRDEIEQQNSEFCLEDLVSTYIYIDIEIHEKLNK